MNRKLLKMAARLRNCRFNKSFRDKNMGYGGIPKICYGCPNFKICYPTFYKNERDVEAIGVIACGFEIDYVAKRNSKKVKKDFISPIGIVRASPAYLNIDNKMLSKRTPKLRKK